MPVWTGMTKGMVLASLLLATTALPLLAQGEVPASTNETVPTPTTEVPAAPQNAAAPAVTAAPANDRAPIEPAAVPDQTAATPITVVEAPTSEDAQADLAAVEASISLSQERIDALKGEIAEMEGDRPKQNAALIAAAQRVKLAEIEITDVEDRLSDLIVRELEVRGRLDGSNAEIANVLAALERISLNPPPALIVDPADALGSARSAILISAIVPQLRAKAEAVTTDLKTLTGIKADALAEEQVLKANYSVLEEEQLRIATLIAARRQGIQTRTAALETEEREALDLAVRATDLKDLVTSLTARVTSVSTAAAAADANVDPDAPVLTPEVIRTALANAARTEPALPFGAAKGYLAMPANGVNVVEYGANDGFGGISQGLSVVTRAEAQVVAPADGWVLYKGPYLNYGQIVILNTGQGYTALLAGLDAITVDIGQFVQMGMPLGTMGSRTIGRSVTTNAGADQPTLYIELRRNNEPLDPTGWWATPTQSG